ncbi:hypothetical protein BDZ91DRAFT_644850, partial [Kalaharituber pfeilii]
PRRLWDLLSNRVVSLDVCARVIDGVYIPMAPESGFWAITHSWTEDMERWMTPINSYQWPVPLPRGITLDQIRWEAMKLGARYCWLDVLCLRQRMMEVGSDGVEVEGDEKAKRLGEWLIDIPTIGNIYRQAIGVIRYFNGLGRQFE